MSLLESRRVYKPHQYPACFQAWEIQQKIHWIPEEVPLGDDVQDWQTNLSPEEKNLLTQIFRLFTQMDVDISECYMSKYLQVFKPTEVRMMLTAFANMECFDDKTELLTSNGWKSVVDITKSDKIAQYDMTTETISFVNPARVVSYDYSGLMHHYENKVTDICVTPNHDLILKHPSSQVVSKKKSYQGKWGRNYLYPVSGYGSGNGATLTKYDRLLIAIQADGSLRGNCPSSNPEWRTCDFVLHKERKITRLTDLLDHTGVTYSTKPKEGGRTVITFAVPGEIAIDSLKTFDWIDLSKISSGWADSFIEEVLQWDGSEGRYWYNTNRAAVDKVQAIASLGYRAASISLNRSHDDDICEVILPNGDNPMTMKDCWVISFSDRVWRTYPHRKEVPYEGKVYCVSVPTQNLVSRRNGKVSFTGNTVHIAAYSHLLDTVGMPEVEYSTFLKYKEMKDKSDYMSGFNVNDIRSIARTLAGVSAFGEGVSLFASFAILLNFTRFGKMKGMGQIVSWSVRDESLHCESMIQLFRMFIQENPEVWDDQMKTEIYDAARITVEMEDAFVDLAFEMGGVQGLAVAEVKQYVRYICDRRLIELGMKPNYGVKENPLPWVDHLISGHEHTNFFENRATGYSKGATLGTWDDAFEKIFKET